MNTEIEKIVLENSGGYYAQRNNGTIQICASDGNQLFAIKTESIPFAPEPLFIVLQVYMNGRMKGIIETKNKVNDLIKLCL
jgi:hypothetical protein